MPSVSQADNSNNSLQDDFLVLDLPDEDNEILNTQVIDPEETKRLTDTIKSFIGYIPKLLAKAPKPVVVVGLTATWLAPIIIDFVITKDTGSLINAIFNKENIGELIQGIISAIGLYSIYSESKVARDVDTGKGPIVRKKPDENNTPYKRKVYELIGRNSLLENEVTDLKKEIRDQKFLISRLIDELRSNPGVSADRLHSLIQLDDNKTECGSHGDLERSQLLCDIKHHQEEDQPGAVIVPLIHSRVEAHSEQQEQASSADPLVYKSLGNN